MASTVRIRVRADDDTDGFRGIRRSVRSLGRSITSQVAAAGVRAGSALSSALTSSVGSVFSAAGSNPYVAAGIAALAAVAAAAIGAAIAGAITLAFGGAFVGLGVMLASQNKQVREDWGRTLGQIKSDFAEAAKPLLPVLDTARRRLGTLAEKFAPHFERAMENAAPHLEGFLDHIGDGIEKFGKIAFKPMMDAFNELLDALGPYIEGFFESLGESFKYLGETVSENKAEIAMLFGGIMQLIPLAIRLVGGLASAWGGMMRQVAKVAGWLQTAWSWVNRTWNRVVSFVQEGIGDAIAWVKDIWGWVNRTWNRVVNFAQQGAAGVIGWVSDIWGWVNRKWGRIVSFGQSGISGVIGWVSRAWGWVNRNWKRAVSFGSRGISGVIGAIRGLWDWVNRTWDRVVNFRFNVSGPVNTIKGLLGFAHGGVVGSVGTAATGGVRGNQVLVGEQGPEIVDLPGGSRVRSNPDTRRLLGQSRGGGGGATVRIEASHDDMSQLLLRVLRRTIRVEGGDVQFVLGQSGR
ncbi:phage tail protein [Streptomyces tendae]|uniref:phage tail protein n=1 Tax=Streptomyces tendae TaxID=1932 RepID=UPI003D75BEAD